MTTTPEYDTLETLCRQVLVDPEYETRIDAELKEKGFLKKVGRLDEHCVHYYKRVQAGNEISRSEHDTDYYNKVKKSDETIDLIFPRGLGQVHSGTLCAKMDSKTADGFEKELYHVHFKTDETTNEKPSYPYGSGAWWADQIEEMVSWAFKVSFTGIAGGTASCILTSERVFDLADEPAIPFCGGFILAVGTLFCYGPVKEKWRKEKAEWRRKKEFNQPASELKKYLSTIEHKKSALAYDFKPINWLLKEPSLGGNQK